MIPDCHSSIIIFSKTIRQRPILLATYIIAIIFFCIHVCKAESDLEDDISKYKDDPIAKWDELGKESVNINFIIAEALGRIKLNGKNVNINSVVIGPGSNVGDIYNIHLNEPGGSTKPNNRSKK
jgi:hypothetical protein